MNSFDGHNQEDAIAFTRILPLSPPASPPTPTPGEYHPPTKHDHPVTAAFVSLTSASDDLVENWILVCPTDKFTELLIYLDRIETAIASMGVSIFQDSMIAGDCTLVEEFAAFAGWTQTEIPIDRLDDIENVKAFAPCNTGIVHVYFGSVMFPLDGAMLTEIKHW
jgi:hypothetical protein